MVWQFCFTFLLLAAEVMERYAAKQEDGNGEFATGGIRASLSVCLAE